jgi:hypothetical protein
MTLSGRIIYSDQCHFIRYDQHNLIGHHLSPSVSLMWRNVNLQPL